MGDDDKLKRTIAYALKKQDVNRALRERLVNDRALQKRVRKDMLKDLHRVHEHPENKSIVSPVSRRCYRDLGHFPEILVQDVFGNHSEFLRAAKLADSRATAKSQARSAALHTEQGIHQYASANLLGWHGKFDRVKKSKRKHLEGVVGSDFHSSNCDPFARSVFLSVIEMTQPDFVVLNGDLVDFPSVSSHPKLPGHFHLSLQAEIDWCVQLFKDVRKACPDTTVYFVIGNHEYRLVRYLADTAPALASLRSVRFHELFQLEELEVSLVCRSNFLAPTTSHRKVDLAENWLKLADCWIATHGTALGKYPAQKELDRFACSGTSGHVHRGQIHMDNKQGTGPMSWMSTPAMCHHSDGRDFVHSYIPWQMGFGRVSILPGKRLVNQHLVHVHEGWATYAGATWTPTNDVLKKRKEMMRP